MKIIDKIVKYKLMKRYIITTDGGLGNQMMNYCLWYYLTSVKNMKAILYPTRDVCLNKIFNNTQKEFPSKWYINAYLKIVLSYIIPIYRRIIRLLHIKTNNILLYFPIKIVEFLGWEDYHFIGEISQLKKIFEFPILDDKNMKVADLMRTSESVSVHVRRGDYQDNVFWRIRLGDICDKAYYTEAISKAESLLTNPTYFVFSDDIEWVKSNLDIKNAIYIDWNKGENSYRDMQLMSYCKCNICANSTFSLMGAWLNAHPDSIRMIPTKWQNQYNDSTFSKYIPNEGWIPINNTIPTVSIIITSPVLKEDIKNLLNQTYTDFEILLEYDSLFVGLDGRVKGNISPSGRLIMRIDNCAPLKERKYLERWVSNELEKQM